VFALGTGTASGADIVRLGQVSLTATSWPAIVATKQGFWAANGIDVQTIQIGIPEGMQAVESDSLDVMHDPCNTVINFIERGARNSALSFVTVATHPGLVIAQKGITTAKALRGKTVGTTAVNSGSTVLLTNFLKSQGLQKGDYDLVGGQSTAQLYTGLMSGVYDAVYLLPPQSASAVESGRNIVGAFRDVSPKFQFACFASNRKWLAKEPAAARRFGKAWLQGVNWLYQPENRKQAEAYLAEAMKLTPAAASQTYDEMIVKTKDIYPRDGKVDFTALQAVIKLMVEAKELPTAPTRNPREYVDETMVKD
jgi:NitT/TauT family transport system substrate-binding protein